MDQFDSTPTLVRSRLFDHVVERQLARAVSQGDEQQKTPIEMRGKGGFVLTQHMPIRDHGHRVHDRKRQC